MEILIRPWQKDDFAAVRRILWESWIASYSSFIPEEDLRAYFEATYRIDSLSRLHDASFVDGFIGEADGEAGGYARVQFQKNEDRLYLASLYILPAFQGKGIGGGLLRAAEGKALFRGLKELWVGVMVKNEAAGRWYERRGFRFVKEEPFQMGRTTVSHRIGCKAIVRSSQDATSAQPENRIPEARIGDFSARGRKISSARRDRDFERSQDADLRRRLFAVYGGDGEYRPLADLTAGLLERQKKSWTALSEGYAALEAAGVREIRGDNWMVKVQFNPRRIVSSGAKLDPESIRKRPCFLCLSHLPPEQQAILYRDEFLVICNPAPIFPGHLTIVHRRHLPQALPAKLEIFLRLAADFGPRMIVSYNGPRCGASAPDHLHFQAAPAGLLPVEAEVLEPRNRAGVGLRKGASLWRTQGLGRGILVIEGMSEAGVSSAFGTVISALRRLNPSDDEPMLNLFCTHTGEGWRLILFPRLKHRPEAYYRQGDEKLLVSPGAADMGGMLITPIRKDFLALDQKLIRGIFHEVALDDAAVEAVIEFSDTVNE